MTALSIHSQAATFALQEPAPSNQRRAGDYYPTPQALADRIVSDVVERNSAEIRTILEPSAGSGSFVRACRAYIPGARITAVEPFAPDDLEAAGADHVVRSELEQSTGRACYDLIIGNPPYSHAEEHVRICLDLLAPGGRLVFLLRLAFLESRRRAALWREHPPARVTVLSERPSFTADGKTDSAAYAVYEWTTEPGPCELGWLFPAGSRPKRRGKSSTMCRSARRPAKVSRSRKR